MGPGLRPAARIGIPKRNYPERDYGGTLERIEDWAYVHE